jgi:hypothetical protein
MTPIERWYTIGCGNKWWLRSGDARVVIWLSNDEKTYKTLIHRRGRETFYPGEFYDLKEAKAECLEEIRASQQEHIDDTN